MAGPQILQNSWDRGIRRDVSKDQIGANAAWDLVDFIPNRRGAPLAKRGGFRQKGTFNGSPGRIRAGIYASMNGGRFILVVDTSSQVYRITPGGGTWSVDGTTQSVGDIKQNPIFYFDDVIFPSHDGTDAVKRANETTVTSYTYTTSYHPEYLTYWKNRMVGATGETIVFGPPGDPNQAWDDTAIYVQTQKIKGLATVRSATLVFYDGWTDILRGTVPSGYGVTADDIRIDSLFPNVGIVDAFSICYWGEQVCWADRQGVYRSDGASLIDITERCGVRDMWRNIFNSWENEVDAGYIRVAAGIFSDMLRISIINRNTFAFIDCFVFDLQKNICWRESNMNHATYIPSPIDPHELYAGWYGSVGRVHEMSHTIDADWTYDESTGTSTGPDVKPVLETPYYRFGNGNQRLVDLYVGYALDATPDTTTGLEVGYTTNPTPGTATYDSYQDGDEVVNAKDIHGVTDTGYHYRKIPVRKEAPGLGVKIRQKGASNTTRIYNISASVIPRQGWDQT